MKKVLTVLAALIAFSFLPAFADSSEGSIGFLMPFHYMRMDGEKELGNGYALDIQYHAFDDNGFVTTVDAGLGVFISDMFKDYEDEYVPFFGANVNLGYGYDLLKFIDGMHLVVSGLIGADIFISSRTEGPKDNKIKIQRDLANLNIGAEAYLSKTITDTVGFYISLRCMAGVGWYFEKINDSNDESSEFYTAISAYPSIGCTIKM